jgi:hypothetical protein
MKKIWLALAGMILAFSASAAQITDGKQYITLDKPAGASRRCSSSRSTARTAISLKKCCMFQIT